MAPIPIVRTRTSDRVGSWGHEPGRRIKNGSWGHEPGSWISWIMVREDTNLGVGIKSWFVGTRTSDRGSWGHESGSKIKGWFGDTNLG